ncbi:hypothetical protein LINPERHAP1_LOCUS12033, partial [Linum perenne]
LLLLAVLIGFLSVTVSAGRPCKTLYISSYTVSFRPLHSLRFPNPSLGHRSAGFVAIVTEIGHQSSLESSSDMIVDRADFPGFEFHGDASAGSQFVHRREEEQEGFNRILPFGISSVSAVLSVVAADKRCRPMTFSSIAMNTIAALFALAMYSFQFPFCTPNLSIDAFDAY